MRPRYKEILEDLISPVNERLRECQEYWEASEFFERLRLLDPSSEAPSLETLQIEEMFGPNGTCKVVERTALNREVIISAFSLEEKLRQYYGLWGDDESNPQKLVQSYREVAAQVMLEVWEKLDQSIKGTPFLEPPARDHFLKLKEKYGCEAFQKLLFFQGLKRTSVLFSGHTLHLAGYTSVPGPLDHYLLENGLTSELVSQSWTEREFRNWEKFNEAIREGNFFPKYVSTRMSIDRILDNIVWSLVSRDLPQFRKERTDLFSQIPLYFRENIRSIFEGAPLDEEIFDFFSKPFFYQEVELARGNRDLFELSGGELCRDFSFQNAGFRSIRIGSGNHVSSHVHSQNDYSMGSDGFSNDALLVIEFLRYALDKKEDNLVLKSDFFKRLEVLYYGRYLTRQLFQASDEVDRYSPRDLKSLSQDLDFRLYFEGGQLSRPGSIESFFYNLHNMRQVAERAQITEDRIVELEDLLTLRVRHRLYAYASVDPNLKIKKRFLGYLEDIASRRGPEVLDLPVYENRSYLKLEKRII